MSQFPLFDTPIDLAHKYWENLLSPTDHVIDATCGNGHDTLMLAQLVPNGHVFAIDNQQQAIDTANEKISMSLGMNVSFHLQCHSNFPLKIQPKSIALVVYNLGYLPGGDKQLTTKRSTTLQSLEKAIPLIRPGGALSITCYPGHPEGALEETAVLELIKTLPAKEWSCCIHRWINRNASPSLLLVQSKMRILDKQ